ncbi:histidine kinase [Methanoplanus sp. FWC-SCC4]|uniref:Histidine kinase n=1 Tax=Methanochimaera problematica TaxID=2609417 RepID=A0AA97FBK8_9EURY|nr:Nramp family divalent metal transporter [Methanoplanus sp. FWC-SCC4]WOF15542.1 histidine kinase [Methanoplanus sp. FWC-SCC4]
MRKILASYIPKDISDKFKFIGPGLLLAIAASGESGIAEAVEIGAHFHFDLIWVILVTLLFKFAFTNGIARYTLSTGETIFEGLKKIPGPKNWTVIFVTVIYLLEMFGFGGMLLFGSIFLDYYLPGVYFSKLIAIMTLAIVMFLLWKDSYERVEKLVIAIAIGLFIGIGYCLLEFGIPMESVAFGLIPTVPHDSILPIMALMGAIGSGLNLLLYSVWLNEKSRGEHGETYFKKYILSVNLDLILAFGLVAVITVLFMTLGVSGFVVSFLGHGEELTIDTLIVQTLYVLSNIPYGTVFFLIFGYLIMFGATVTGMDGRARAISSIIKSSTETKLDEKKIYRILLGVFSAIIISAIIMGDPTKVIHYVAAMASIMFALLGFMAIYIDLTLPAYSRGSRLWLLVMIFGSSAFLLMALLMEGSLIEVGLPLIERLVLLIVPVYIFMRTDLFKKCIQKKLERYDLIWIILIFGGISVYGALRGIPYSNVIISAGHVGPMIAGIICGPFAGGFSGLIGGFYIMQNEGDHSFIFALSTIVAGILAGYFTRYWRGGITYSKAVFMVLSIEIFNLVILPLILKPEFETLKNLLRTSFVPMTIVNMTGVLIFVYFLKEGGYEISAGTGLTSLKEKIFRKNSKISKKENKGDKK